MSRRLVSMMDTLCPSFMPRCSTVSLVQSTLMLLGFDLVRKGETASLLSTSDGRMMRLNCSACLLQLFALETTPAALRFSIAFRCLIQRVLLSKYIRASPKLRMFLFAVAFVEPPSFSILYQQKPRVLYRRENYSSFLMDIGASSL
ncbi:uncharacterized protein LOC109820003 [Asparagus officinalis]|uniref:uncharacterized protein LOC109820003 n=1 Tax=Asparagus officinalis TaxID=4686 RepID=UPI00098DE640|nr:uncharacterized protein LOC109820003 [Asparagus officinalis]